MKKTGLFFLVAALMLLTSCNKKKTAFEILQETINSIDTVETIVYKQEMMRTDPRNTDDTLFRYREMVFKRAVADSVVGVSGHWYMFDDDRNNVIYEDIYDGNVLIRKNNRDSTARIYDLIRYQEFKKEHFWGHNTPFGMQHELQYILDHIPPYSLKRMNDTIIDGFHCYQISVYLEDRVAMPGFAIELKDHPGSVSSTFFCIDRVKYFPVRMKSERFSKDNPAKRIFIDQRYFDIEFNTSIDEQEQFNTTGASIEGFEKIEMKPE